MNRRSVGGQLWAEFVGTAILILLGCGVVANTIFASRLGAPEAAPFSGYNWNTITFGWAFAVVMAVYVAGGITGAHLNPAVTLAAIVTRGISVGVGLMYMLAQVIGAMVGAALVHLMYMGDFNAGYKNPFYTTPGANYGDATLNWYVAEFIGTFALLLFINAIVDNVRNVGPGANLWPFMVGMAVLSIGLSLGGPTGYAINPARDFGPRLYAFLTFSADDTAFKTSYWLAPIIGPLLGGVAGSLFYNGLLKPFLPFAREADPQPADTRSEHVTDVGKPVLDDGSGRIDDLPGNRERI